MNLASTSTVEAVKIPVRVATTTNGALSTAYAAGQSVDGVTLAAGDRILVKDQTTTSENGIYTANDSGAPTPARDVDQDWKRGTSTVVFAQEGTTNAQRGFVVTDIDPWTVTELVPRATTVPAPNAQGGVTGTSSSLARADHSHPTTALVRALGSFYQDVANSGDTETDVYGLTIGADTIGAAGEAILVDYSGLTAAHATNTRRLRLYFAGVAFVDTTAVPTTTATTWRLWGQLLCSVFGSGGTSCTLRNSLTLQWYTTTGTVLAVGTDIGDDLTGIDLTANQTLKMTVQAGAAETDAIIAKTGLITCATGT